MPILNSIFTSNNKSIFYVTTKDIYKGKIAYKKQNLEQNCVLQESCKTVRRWQRPILLVKGGHCVGDWWGGRRADKFGRPGGQFWLETCDLWLVVCDLWLMTCVFGVIFIKVGDTGR